MSCSNRQKGFSLIELVVMITIIAILATFAAARLVNQNEFIARGYFDELVSATRFAQRYAVASGCTVRITINNGDYSLTTQDATCGAGTNVLRPGGGAFSGIRPAGVNVTPAGVITHDFDALGETDPGGNVSVQGDSNIYTMTIHATSGFVET